MVAFIHSDSGGFVHSSSSAIESVSWWATDKNKFGQGIYIYYAVELLSNPRTKEVISVACKLCKFFGRDNDDSAGRKRKRTENIKYFKHQFRPENYKSHAAQHGSK
jgi:hypothetical protein